MSEQEAPAKRARPTKGKSNTVPEQAQQSEHPQQQAESSQALPRKEQQEGTSGQARPYQPKEIGKPWTQHKDIPPAVVQATLERFGRPGVQLQMAVPRENGTYKGEALEAGDYLVQRVGESSAVFHRKQDITLSDKLGNNRKYINGAQLAVYYDGSAGKAYPHDPVAERIDIYAANFKSMAAKLNLPDLEQFKSSVDQIKVGLHAELLSQRQAKNLQQQERREKAQQERSHER